MFRLNNRAINHVIAVYEQIDQYLLDVIYNYDENVVQWISWEKKRGCGISAVSWDKVAHGGGHLMAQAHAQLWVWKALKVSPYA